MIRRQELPCGHLRVYLIRRQEIPPPHWERFDDERMTGSVTTNGADLAPRKQGERRIDLWLEPTCLCLYVFRFQLSEDFMPQPEATHTSTVTAPASVWAGLDEVRAARTRRTGHRPLTGSLILEALLLFIESELRR